MIIKDHLDDRDLVARCRRKLIHIHAETAVSRDIEYVLIRHTDLRPDTGAKPVSHRPHAAGRQKRPRVPIGKILRRPHLMLPDVGGNNGVTARQLVNPLNDIRAGQHIVAVAHRHCCLSGQHFIDPRPVVLVL